MFFSSSCSTCIACGSQFISCPVWKPIAKVLLGGWCRLACGLDGGIDMHQRPRGVIQEGLARAVSSTPRTLRENNSTPT